MTLVWAQGGVELRIDILQALAHLTDKERCAVLSEGGRREYESSPASWAEKDARIPGYDVTKRPSFPGTQ